MTCLFFDSELKLEIRVCELWRMDPRRPFLYLFKDTAVAVWLILGTIEELLTQRHMSCHHGNCFIVVASSLVEVLRKERRRVR